MSSLRLGAEEAATLLATLCAAPSRPAGRFLSVWLPDGAASLAQALARGRPGSVLALRRQWPRHVVPPDRAAAGRLAVALRQDLWRTLRGVRGVAPAACVRFGGEGTEATVIAGFLGGVAASPVTLDVLHRIVEDAAVRQSLLWAARASPCPRHARHREVP